MDHIKGMAAAIVSARDFCGNEIQAAKDYCADYGIKFALDDYSAAQSVAAGIWRQSQQEAGVKRKYWKY